MMADMGIVLMIVVPCLVVVGETPLIFRIVGLFPVPPAWDVVMIVVGLPSAEVTSFKMVPAGSGPFVWEGEILCKQLEKHRLCQEFNSVSWAVLALMQIADLNDLCERVRGSLACYC